MTDDLHRTLAANTVDHPKLGRIVPVEQTARDQFKIGDTDVSYADLARAAAAGVIIANDRGMWLCYDPDSMSDYVIPTDRGDDAPQPS